MFYFISTYLDYDSFEDVDRRFLREWYCMVKEDRRRFSWVEQGNRVLWKNLDIIREGFKIRGRRLRDFWGPKWGG